MNSRQFNSNKSTIRGSREKEPEKKTNWDRIIYLTLFSVAVAGLSYYLIKRNLFVNGDGRVVTNELRVLSPSDIRFQEFFVMPGDTVEKKDTLFSFTFVEWQQSMDSVETLKKRLTEAQLDLEDIQNRLRITRLETEKQREQLEYYEDRLTQVNREVRLGVATSNDLKNIQDRIQDLKGDISISNEEQQILTNQRNKLQRIISSPYGDDGTDIPNAAANMKHIYSSPVDGVVTSVYKSDSELGLKSELVMSIISEKTQLKIKAIFDQNDGKHLSIGDNMNINFDNGEKSVGVITDIYAAESILDQPENSQSELEFSIQIVAELRPESPLELNRWKSYNKMGVTVTKTIF